MNQTHASSVESKDQTKKRTYEIKAEVPNGSKWFLFVKRLFDIVAALLASIVLLIPMVLIAILIRLDSNGPVLFWQERLGKNGLPFQICKFRTMVPDAEKDGPQLAKRNDKRCTKLGLVLRKTHLDELPQLWNILKGEMSVVGPRPERAHFYDEFETYIHGFKNRLAVTPGLTGLAQINGGYDLLPEEKIVYDMEYIRTQSIGLDLKLIFSTVKAIFIHERAK